MCFHPDYRCFVSASPPHPTTAASSGGPLPLHPWWAYLTVGQHFKSVLVISHWLFIPRYYQQLITLVWIDCRDLCYDEQKRSILFSDFFPFRVFLYRTATYLWSVFPPTCASQTLNQKQFWVMIFSYTKQSKPCQFTQPLFRMRDLCRSQC